ncbi:MAG: glycosyltransferase, partial [Roseiflexaceae bacterium]|nr:glycosyltransferase [Roseiflexaceae bacterium]
PYDLSFRIWQRKQAAFRHVAPSRLHIVALSNWIAKEARRSTLFGHIPISVIPNGIDATVFAPADRNMARNALAIPPDARVVMFSAGSIENRRKGLPQLIEALNGLSQHDDIILLSLGGGKPALNGPLRHIHLGHVENDKQIAQAYRAADLFVIPSLQENLPNTALEAMSCGTPVVGFDAGGIPDLVRPGITGLLAPVGDIGALRTAIAALLDDAPRRTAMGSMCRQIVLNEYLPELQVQRYATIYRQLITD